jgi:hypothetical protein
MQYLKPEICCPHAVQSVSIYTCTAVLGQRGHRTATYFVVPSECFRSLCSEVKEI